MSGETTRFYLTGNKLCVCVCVCVCVCLGGQFTLSLISGTPMPAWSRGQDLARTGLPGFSAGHQHGAGLRAPAVVGEVGWAELGFRVGTLDLLRGIMLGVRTRGLEKGGSAKPTKMAKEGSTEEVELERSSGT